MSKAEGEVALGLIADVLIDVGNYLTLPGFESLILTHILQLGFMKQRERLGATVD